VHDTPFTLRVVPRVVGPVDFVHACVERGEHARRARIAAPRAFGAHEQGADRHHRQIEAEGEPLCDARRGAQSGKGAWAGAERDRVAVGERQPGFGEKFADRGQKPRAGHGARFFVTDPCARLGASMAGGVAGSSEQRYRAEFGGGIEGEKHGLSHGPYCNRRRAHRCALAACSSQRVCCSRLAAFGISPRARRAMQLL